MTSDKTISKSKSTQDPPVLTAQEARRLFRYDPQTGKLFWQQPAGTRGKIGNEAGALSCWSDKYPAKYRQVCVNRKKYLVHRIIWLMHYGVWPGKHTDHIDGNTTNNRLDNMRSCDSRKNQQNRESHRNGRLVGAHIGHGGRWTSRIRIEGKSKHLGTYDTELEAHKAYLKAVESL